MKFFYRLFFLLLLTAFSVTITYAQQNSPGDSTKKTKSVIAGPQYKRSAWHNYLWGKNYRKEWSTPVKLPVFLLKDREGGLTAVKEGGGHQTTSLHLETKDGKNYTLRSVDKRLGKVLPESFKGTFIEKQVNDEVSMSNPYAAITVPLMAQSAGIYHTNPEYVYLPPQEALDSFNAKFDNNVYLFEQRLKGDWSNADNLGNFDKFYSTDEVMQLLHEESENRADQKTFIKDRLFDMLIGDWDRHEDQWGWGQLKKGDRRIYVPVPEDRDQVYFKHNGKLLDAAIYLSGINYFQSFKHHISNVKTLNYEERGLDRVFTNELTKGQWISIAKELQNALTNNIIETAVKKLPPEVFPFSGKKIIGDLKSRRNHLIKYATQYYLFLSKDVEITGTKEDDYFEVKRLNDNETTVNVYKIKKDGDKKAKPYYSRTFFTNETKEVRLFGLSGNDVYVTDGKVGKGIKIRIIGGYDKDSIMVNSMAGNHTKTYVYDGTEDHIQSIGKVQQHLSSDSDIHKYAYRSYLYDKIGSSASLFYSDADRLFVGVSYGWTHFKWRQKPFVFKQKIGVNYSLSQRALNFIYTGLFPNAIGKWNLALLANYDAIRWTNFYGLGNESILTTKNLDYNRMRTREGIATIGFNRKAGNNYFDIQGFYQSVKIVNDADRYTFKSIAPQDSTVFKAKDFAGITAGYTFSKLNDAIVPTAGIIVALNGSYTQNTNDNSKSFWKYGGNLQLYVPLFYKFSLAVSGAIQTVDGSPEFYQYPSMGGGQDLRGFQHQRFYGKTAFYNSNEFRFISNVRSYLFNGKAGLLAFVDDGRVWMPNENSNTLHVGYGGGIILDPFNFIFVDITYGFSNEDRLLQFRLNVNL
ncbi:MAG TPA: BamA/TamA family outer membrane protein [Ginsengibacter sp.]